MELHRWKRLLDTEIIILLKPSFRKRKPGEGIGQGSGQMGAERTAFRGIGQEVWYENRDRRENKGIAP